MKITLSRSNSKYMLSEIKNPAKKRLKDYLANKYESAVNFEQLTPDASTREYFRIFPDDKSAIACVYPKPFAPSENTYIEINELFRRNDLPVAEIYEIIGDSGIIIQEDLGDKILRGVLAEADDKTKENLISEAIKLIVKIQAATSNAFDSKSIASKLSFDVEKLLWELDFFKTHYFESFLKTNLTEEENDLINSEFLEIADELSKQAKVLCHRDFHAANLMLDAQNKMRIIDHQDARIGAVSYDLVSLLLDRITETPDQNRLDDKKSFFLDEREKIGLEKISPDDFNDEFELMTIQRCLKAIGTFSNQAANFGKINYIQFIEPMLKIVLNAAERMGRFQNLQEIIKEKL